MPDIENGLLMPLTDETGKLIVSSSYDFIPEEPLWISKKFTTTAGQTTFVDIQITNQKYLLSGEYQIINPQNATTSDYIEFSIIDKDDVLRLFSQYNLTKGTDILEVLKYVKEEYICTNGYRAGYNRFELGKSAKPLVPGLYLRVAYNSFGNQNLEIIVRFLFMV